MTIKLITSFVLAFLFASAFGKYYVPWLLRRKYGQEIKTEVAWHTSKAGTPTMGGVMFILAVAFCCLTVGAEGMLHGRFEHIFVLLFASVFGAIGVLDDWKKIDHRSNGGLSSRSKFLLQLAAALVFILILRQIGFVSPHLYVPFFQKTVYMPEWMYLVFSAFVIVGTVNAVNLTDGVDGLAAGTSIPVFLFFALVSFAWGQRFQELGVFASAMIGGLLGFLIYNFNPAKCFMGDTGSLFLGGAISGLAFAYDMPLILVTLGFLFILETLSDIIQVSYFKLTKRRYGEGRRIFKMAPLHHHLEMGGWTGRKWKEKELFVLFTGISLLTSIISFMGVLHRYP